MQIALEQAKLAMENNEVPVGAVMTHQKKIIAKAHNHMHKEKNPLLHAEVLVMQKALDQGYDLRECELFVTLEPCLMCAGAIDLADIKSVYFGAYDSKMGQIDHNYCVLSHKSTLEIYGGYYENESKDLLQSFFKSKRR